MHAALERGVRLDPGFAPAHLQLGLSQLTGGVAGARPHLVAAARHADRLSERDGKLLRAVLPCVESPAGDFAPCLGTLRTLLSGDFATDPFLHALTGWLLLRAGEPGEGLTIAIRGLDLDPRFAFGWLTRGALEAFLGRYDDALASFEACTKQSPGATACLRAKAYLHAHMGEPDACERTARLLVDRSPQDPIAALLLADALAANRRPTADVRAAALRAIDLTPEPDQAATRARLEGALAVRAGDLASAVTHYEAALAAGAKSGDPRRVRLVVWPLLELLHELERDGRAVEIAEQVEKSTIGEAQTLDADPYAPFHQLTPLVVLARYRAKAIDSDGRRNALEAFLSARPKTTRPLAAFAWLAAWGATSETKNDAVDAFARLREDALALPTYAPGVPRLAGRSLRLAGRWDDAIAELEPASRSCLALSAPLADIQARVELGLALEGKKDEAGACAAFQSALEPFTKAKVLPLSARRAKKRLAALSCGGPK
jgi:serine/threonine-protein kinase